MPPSKNISFDELSKYFHLPINQVAKELGVCATILKKICRRNGIPRWPHRKIKSLDKMISNLNMNLEKNPNERDDILREIDLLKSKKLEIMKNPDILVEIPKGIQHLIPSGTDFMVRPPPGKALKQTSVKPKTPYGLTSFKVKEILEGSDAPLNCFSSVSYYSERPQYIDTPQQQPRMMEQKPIVEAVAYQRPAIYHNVIPQPDMPFSFDLPKPSTFTPMSPGPAPRQQQMQNHPNHPNHPNPPPGVTHNFAFPSFDFYPAPELPALRLQDWENKYKRTLPILEPLTPTSSSQQSQPSSNNSPSFPSVAQVVSPSRSFSISAISQPTQTPMFPEWYTQEKDRIFRSSAITTPTNH